MMERIFMDKCFDAVLIAAVIASVQILISDHANAEISSKLPFADEAYYRSQCASEVNKEFFKKEFVDISEENIWKERKTLNFHIFEFLLVDVSTGDSTVINCAANPETGELVTSKME